MFDDSVTPTPPRLLTHDDPKAVGPHGVTHKDTCGHGGLNSADTEWEGGRELSVPNHVADAFGRVHKASELRAMSLMIYMTFMQDDPCDLVAPPAQDGNDNANNNLLWTMPMPMTICFGQCQCF